MSELQGLMRTAWHGSLLHRFVAFWQNCWSASAVRGFLVWLMSLPYPYERSRAHEGLARLNRRLAGADRARNAIYTSRVHRAWAAVARVGRGSRLLGWVFREGMTGVLLLILNISMIGPITMMVTQQKPVDMTLIPAIVMAAYTTYKITMASVQMLVPSWGMA